MLVDHENLGIDANFAPFICTKICAKKGFYVMGLAAISRLLKKFLSPKIIYNRGLLFYVMKVRFCRKSKKTKVKLIMLQFFRPHSPVLLD